MTVAASLSMLVPALLASIAAGACAARGPDVEKRAALDRERALRPGRVAPQCHELQAVIPAGGALEGPACPDNRAVVNGWSEKCVGSQQCNTPARRAELNQAAEAFCASWCAAKRCGYRYGARDACDSNWCMDSDFCRRNCDAPLLDTCYFQQAAPAYNCECLPGVVP
ncbi:MAG TPA: hypothetical protein VII13_04255 [Vicinamibacteria bacterium]|jgi:hypothetical protein